MPQNQPLIRLERVNVDIAGRRILNDVSVQIAPAEHWGVVGDNGSGKSTLLRIIAGTLWPSPQGGTRTYDFGSGPERDAVTARSRITLVGHELQDLYAARGWNFRCREIVHSGVTRSDIPQRRASQSSLQQAERLLETMRLAHLADRRLLELSRGEQRRVLIARSLAFDPVLLLLDEPASGLDIEARAELESMLSLAAKATQLVVATHELADLPQFVTRALVVANRHCRILNRSPARADAGGDTKPREAAHPRSRRHGAPTEDAREMIVLENVEAWLEHRRILHGVNWTLRSGEHWLVTGPNGAGKSTLLRLLHGEIRPARGGRIGWPGLGNPKSVWELRRQVALVSPELQARYRYPTTVFEAVASGLNASIGLTRRLSPDERERVDTLLARFELEPLRERLLSTLSYGQRHRALIARTLAPGPKILLLDEPWEGMDSQSVDLISAELNREIAAGAQLVCVSHVGPKGLPLTRRLKLEAGGLRVDDSFAPGENSTSEPQPKSGFRQR